MKKLLFLVAGVSLIGGLTVQTIHGITEADLRRTIVSMNTRIFDTRNLYENPLETNHIALWDELVEAMNTYVNETTKNKLLINSLNKATQASRDLFAFINKAYALLRTEKDRKVVTDVAPMIKEKFADIEKLAQELKTKLTKAEFNTVEENNVKGVLVLFVSFMRFQAKKAREHMSLQHSPNSPR